MAPMRKILLISIPLIAVLTIGIFAIYPILLPSFLSPSQDSVPLIFERGEVTKVSDHIYIGPYPTDDEFVVLSKSHVTTVVSLLNPDLNPAEAELVKKERILASRYGIEFLNYPMVPWILGNERALADLEEVIRDPDRILYIHCYLGLHRVSQVVKAFDLDAEVFPLESLPERFERGSIDKFSEVLSFGPYPTDDEFQILSNSRVTTIISLLTEEISAERVWIDRERKVAESFGFKYIAFPLNPETIEDEEVNRVVNYLTSMEGHERIYVHAFLARDKDPRLSQVFLAYSEWWKTQQGG